jgi:hypothetical protein
MVRGSREIREEAERRASGEGVTPGKLMIGSVYRKRDGTLHAYLGRCRAPDAQVDDHAFIEMPLKPERRELSSLGPGADKLHFKRINEVSNAWDRSTWSERCRWDWTEKWGKDSTAPLITLMRSPKFDAAVSALELNMVQQIRDNAAGQHGYKRAGMKLHDLAWDWNVEGRKPPNGRYWTVDDVDSKKARRLYCSSIVWRQ